MNKIFRNYRNKSFTGRRKFQSRIYEGFNRSFFLNGVYLIAEEDNIYGIEKFEIVLDYRQQSCVQV